jgi:hypothetical protein
MTDLSIPDIFDRKKTPVAPATLEERREYAANSPTPVEPPRLGIGEEELREEKKAKARVRITKMKVSFAVKAERDAIAAIPEKYLCWDSRRLRFYDTRTKAERKLKRIREEMGLE